MDSPDNPTERRLLELQTELNTLKTALRTTIAWIQQSAASPLSLTDAQALIAMIGPDRDLPPT